MKSFFRYAVGTAASLPGLPGEVQDMLMWPIASRLLGPAYKEKVWVQDGFYMNGSMEDILSRKILFQGSTKKYVWEPQTAALLSELSKTARHILIAGSHIGYLVLLAARATRGRVTAFEPEPVLFRASQANFALNPELNKKITLIPKALGEASGEVDLYSEDIRSSVIPYSGGHVSHAHIIKVPLTTIDESTKGDYPDLILLDIEGYEWNALLGAVETLVAKPHMILEVSPKILALTNVTPEMIFERLETLGYDVRYLDQDKDYANIYAKPR